MLYFAKVRIIFSISKIVSEKFTKHTLTHQDDADYLGVDAE